MVNWNKWNNIQAVIRWNGFIGVTSMLQLLGLRKVGKKGSMQTLCQCVPRYDLFLVVQVCASTYDLCTIQSNYVDRYALLCIFILFIDTVVWLKFLTFRIFFINIHFESKRFCGSFSFIPTCNKLWHLPAWEYYCVILVTWSLFKVKVCSLKSLLLFVSTSVYW